MKIPLLSANMEFTTTGQQVVCDFGAGYIPSKYSMEVVGLNAAGAVVAPSAWDVLLLASLDGKVYNEASKILEHVNTSNGNGDVVFSAGNFYPARFWAVKCKALTLGALATKISVSILGIA